MQNIFRNDLSFKVFYMLSMLYFTINLIGIPVTYKLITLGPLTGPGGLVILPLIFLIEDIIVEIYGYKLSRFLLWLILSSTIIFSLVIYIIVQLPSPAYWHLQQSYADVFNPTLKSAPAAVLAIFSGRFLNIILMSKWKILTIGKYFWLRSVFSTIIGSSLALSIFYVISFSGGHTFSEVKTLFFSDIIIRVCYTMIGGIPASIIVRYLNSKLNINHNDKTLSFNPFSLNINES